MRRFSAILLFGTLSLTAQTPSPGIRVVQHLDFGGVVVDEQGGMATLTHQNLLLSQGEAVRSALRSATAEARFDLTGPKNCRFQVFIEPQTPILEGSKGGSLRVESFETGPEGLTGQFNDLGQAELRLGARIHLPLGAIPGLYTNRQVRLQLVVMNGSKIEQTNEVFTIKCHVRPVLRIQNQGALDFGNLIPGASRGVYKVPAEGQPTTLSGGVRQFKGDPKPATFVIRTSATADYSIELPPQMLLQGPGEPLEVHDFECSIPQQGIVPAGGVAFRVGASIVVPPAQRNGIYRGQFRVSVNYQ